MSQPRPRTWPSAAGVAGRVISATVSGESTRAPFQRAAVQQHPAEAREVGGGAEQPGVAGHAAHAPRRRIVHDAAQHRRGGPPHGHASGAQASVGAMRLASDGGRQKHRVAHAERLEDARLREMRRASRALDARDDLAEQEEVDVAVDEPLPGRGDGHFLGGAAGSPPPRPRTSVPGRGRRAGPETCVSRWRMVMRCLP